MKTKEHRKAEEEEPECGGFSKGSKPYKVKYRIITEGEESVCINKNEDIVDSLITSLSMRAWDLGDFEVIILEKKRIEHIDE